MALLLVEHDELGALPGFTWPLDVTPEAKPVYVRAAPNEVIPGQLSCRPLSQLGCIQEWGSTYRFGNRRRTTSQPEERSSQLTDEKPTPSHLRLSFVIPGFRV